jgi:hypothetical protein
VSPFRSFLCFLTSKRALVLLPSFAELHAVLLIDELLLKLNLRLTCSAVQVQALDTTVGLLPG